MREFAKCIEHRKDLKACMTQNTLYYLLKMILTS